MRCGNFARDGAKWVERQQIARVCLMKGFGFLGFVAFAILTLSPAKAASTCSALAPNSDPDVNYRSIVDCLSSSEHAAHLATGVAAVAGRLLLLRNLLPDWRLARAYFGIHYVRHTPG